MIPLTTLHLAHLPPDLAVHIALCADLQNAAFLRQQLLAGNAAFEYALLDASSILSPTHLHAAIFRAATDAAAGRLKSHNLHAEIVFALSANNNIADSFRKFGLTAHTTNLVIVKLTPASGAASAAERAAAAAVGAHLEAQVRGRWERFGEASCGAMADVGRIGGVYKLGVGAGRGRVTGRGGRGSGTGTGRGRGSASASVGESGTGTGSEGGRDERAEMEVTILGLMALRGAA
ncbi:hypothetical protein MMC32_008313 [Xylographa parallela]|nr:hypothetical protein [Xylographa parallela]